MTTYSIRRALVAAILLGGPLTAVSAPSMAASCDAGTLTGTYTYSYTGFSITAKHERIAFATSGSGTYDGRGHIKGASTTTTTDGKQTRAKPIPYTGVYSVTSDCHVLEADTDVGGGVTHYDQYTTPTGNSVSFVETDYNVVATGIQIRN